MSRKFERLKTLLKELFQLDQPDLDWEEIALALLKKYTEPYYTFRKREWEQPHLEYQDLEITAV
jgi:hypothetical protein